MDRDQARTIGWIVFAFAFLGLAYAFLPLIVFGLLAWGAGALGLRWGERMRELRRAIHAAQARPTLYPPCDRLTPPSSLVD
jgi:hypothetical protein